MSRNRITFDNKKILLIRGDDHAVGKFIQIFYADKEVDGVKVPEILLDWDEMFKFGMNHIGAVTDDLNSNETLAKKTESFIETLRQKSLN
jgi:hypothetical protein